MIGTYLKWTYTIGTMVGFVVSIFFIEDQPTRAAILFLMLMAQNRFAKVEQDLTDHRWNDAAHEFKEYWRR